MSIKVKKKIEDNICFKEDDLKKKKWLGDVFLRISKDITIFFLQIYNCEES